MDIILSQRLKELRREKGTTQEDFANHLMISISAVSKWERGEGLPDINYLPKISAYYNVTVDDLLGVGEIRKQERIYWYYDESQKLQNLGKISEAVALWREALKEFPNDHPENFEAYLRRRILRLLCLPRRPAAPLACKDICRLGESGGKGEISS